MCDNPLSDKVQRDESIHASIDLGIVTRLLNFPTTYGTPPNVKDHTRKARHYFSYLDKSLSDKELLGNEIGGKVGIEDFAWYHIVDCTNEVDGGEAIKKFTRVKEWMENIEGREGVREYLDKRKGLGELGEHTL